MQNQFQQPVVQYPQIPQPGVQYGQPMMQQPMVQYAQQPTVYPSPVMVQSESTIDQVFGPNKNCLVKQRVEPFELLTGIETKNKYDIVMTQSLLRLVALEESSFLQRCFCGPQRGFSMRVCYESTKQEILRFERPFTLGFLQNIKVYDTVTNKYLGCVKYNCWRSICSREFDVFESTGNRIYRIQSPCCSFWTFNILDNNDQIVGQIKKKWSGLLKELYTDSDNFGVEFPASATPTHKAILFGATFLIDFLYFEKKNSNE